MLNFTLVIGKSIVSDSTQAIKFSEYIVHFLLKHISTAGKSQWQPFPPIFAPWGTEGIQFAAFVTNFFLPESTAGVQDTKVGSSTDLGYHIIYGSHIVWGALDGFIEITGVEAQANGAIRLSCDNHGVSCPMTCTHRVLVEECLLVLVVPVLLGRHLVAGLELALGGFVLGLCPG